MAPEQILGRLDALEWLLSMVLADALARAPVPHTAAAGFRAVLDQQTAAALHQVRAHGESPEGWRAAAMADALVDLRDAVLRQTVAATADSSGPRN